MSDLNQMTFTGRLGADVEVRRNQDGKPIANLRVACSEQWRDKNSGDRKESVEWLTVVIFNENLCKIAEQYLKKGSKVLIQGQIKTRKWIDQTGNDRYSTEVVLSAFNGILQMLDGKDDSPRQEQRQERREPAKKAPAPSFSRDMDDETIPF